ncbi:MAG: hypothetical protein PWQ96_2397 [Clostridia bacterium]|nr:hypothetical protein [Rikenellaceae bacterium]MDK2986753.1 hypothetical protein [Clostridia bacterium]
MDNIEIIKDGQEILAIIIRNDFYKEGVHFFTPDDFSQQLAYMHHKKGKKIKPHIHNLVKREVYFTQEVLFIKKGKIKVDLYCKNKTYHSSHILNAGDVILLAGGGHGFEILEDVEMIEVKQGPYAGEMDKTYFEGIS